MSHLVPFPKGDPRLAYTVSSDKDHEVIIEHINMEGHLYMTSSGAVLTPTEIPPELIVRISRVLDGKERVCLFSKQLASGKGPRRLDNNEPMKCWQQDGASHFACYHCQEWLLHGALECQRCQVEYFYGSPEAEAVRRQAELDGFLTAVGAPRVHLRVGRKRRGGGGHAERRLETGTTERARRNWTDSEWRLAASLLGMDRDGRPEDRTHPWVALNEMDERPTEFHDRVKILHRPEIAVEKDRFLAALTIAHATGLAARIPEPRMELLRERAIDKTKDATRSTRGGAPPPSASEGGWGAGTTAASSSSAGGTNPGFGQAAGTRQGRKRARR